MSARVLVVDDHPLFREGLSAALSAMPDVEVVGEAGDGVEAVEMALELRPDVVLMDLQLPLLGGVEATRRLTDAAPEVAVLVLTMVEGEASVAAALRAGARGYLLKGADRAEIARALDAAAHGAVYLPAALARRASALLASAAAGAEANRPFPHLTPREYEVLDLLARGLSNAAIAARLHLSPKTVRNAVSTVLTKVHARDRQHAIELGVEAGLGEPQ
jgi:DNA-binding NarL/FixJ family response regulator